MVGKLRPRCFCRQSRIVRQYRMASPDVGKCEKNGRDRIKFSSIRAIMAFEVVKSSCTWFCIDWFSVDQAVSAT
jgi:hypothetical protein